MFNCKHLKYISAKILSTFTESEIFIILLKKIDL